MQKYGAMILPRCSEEVICRIKIIKMFEKLNIGVFIMVISGTIIRVNFKISLVYFVGIAYGWNTFCVSVLQWEVTFLQNVTLAHGTCTVSFNVPEERKIYNTKEAEFKIADWFNLAQNRVHVTTGFRVPYSARHLLSNCQTANFSRGAVRQRTYEPAEVFSSARKNFWLSNLIRGSSVIAFAL